MITKPKNETERVMSLIRKAIKKDALNADQRKHIAESNFAIPPDRYPIHDLDHAKNALARSSGKPEEARVKAAVYRKWPSLKPEGA